MALVGDETGLLKIVDLESNVCLSFGEQNRLFSVKSLFWQEIDKQFTSLRANGILETYSIVNESLELMQSTSLELKTPIGAIPLQGSPNLPLMCYGAEGNLIFLNKEEDEEGYVVSQEHIVPGPVECCKSCDGGLVFGGRENDAQMFDIESSVVSWKAKNVPHDNLSLRVPIWVCDVHFLNGTSNSSSGAHILAGTGHKHVRLYDTKAQRAPVFNMEVSDEYRVTRICPIGELPIREGSGVNSSLPHVYVSDTAGGLTLWDLRMNKRRLSTLHGSHGSIRNMCTSPETDSTLITVGLDRYLRSYSTKTNKIQSSIYLKNRLNCCLLFSDQTPKSSDDNEGNYEDGDSDAEDELEEMSNSDEEEEQEEESEEEIEEQQHYKARKRGASSTSSKRSRR